MASVGSRRATVGRKDGAFSKELKEYLFTDKSIVQIEEHA